MRLFTEAGRLIRSEKELRFGDEVVGRGHSGEFIAVTNWGYLRRFNLVEETLFYGPLSYACGERVVAVVPIQPERRIRVDTKPREWPKAAAKTWTKSTLAIATRNGRVLALDVSEIPVGYFSAIDLEKDCVVGAATSRGARFFINNDGVIRSINCRQKISCRGSMGHCAVKRGQIAAIQPWRREGWR